jgi:hypothetical protein
MVEITAIEKPDRGASVWSGAAKSGRDALQWFYLPNKWLHVLQQQRGGSWLKIEPTAAIRAQVQRAIRRARP